MKKVFFLLSLSFIGQSDLRASERNGCLDSGHRATAKRYGRLHAA